jgi:membrane protein YdbS with pleckstrin-like domain
LIGGDMKNYWIISLIAGLIALFFFPEPETNFIAYLATAIVFIILTIILFKRARTKSRQ